MKTGTKVFLGVLASAILVGGLGALTRGFTNWDPDTWLDQWQTEDPNDSEDPNGSDEDTKVEGEKVEVAGLAFAAEPDYRYAILATFDAGEVTYAFTA